MKVSLNQLTSTFSVKYKMRLAVEVAGYDGYLGKRFEENRELFESWQKKMRKCPGKKNTRMKFQRTHCSI